MGLLHQRPIPHGLARLFLRLYPFQLLPEEQILSTQLRHLHIQSVHILLVLVVSGGLGKLLVKLKHYKLYGQGGEGECQKRILGGYGKLLSGGSQQDIQQFIVQRMKPRLRLKTYTLENGQYIPQFEQQQLMSPLSRTASQVGMRTLSHSDQQLQVHSTKAVAAAPHPTTHHSTSSQNYPQNPQQHLFKKKMLQMIQQSEFSFNLQLQQKQLCLKHYQQKYKTLETRYLNMQCQLAQATAKLRLSAMSEAEHHIEVKEQEAEIHSLRELVRLRESEIGSFRREVEDVRMENRVNGVGGKGEQEGNCKDREAIRQLSENLWSCEEEIAALRRELQRKDYTIDKLEKEVYERMVISEEDEFGDGYQYDKKHQAEVLKNKLKAKEEEVGYLNGKLQEMREKYETTKTEGDVSILKANQQIEQIRLLQEQNSRLLTQISQLQQLRRAAQSQPQPPLPLPPSFPQPPTSQLTRSLLLLQTTKSQNDLLNHRITQLTNLLVQRDQDINSQHNLIHILQQQLKLAAICRKDKLNSQINGNILRKSMNHETDRPRSRDSQVSRHKLAMEMQLSEFHQVLEEKEKEIDQLHRYIGKLEEVVELVEEKEAARGLREVQTQTDIQQKHIKKNSSEISLRNPKLFKEIGEHSCQTDQPDPIITAENECQTDQIMSLVEKQQQTKETIQTSVLLKTQSESNQTKDSPTDIKRRVSGKLLSLKSNIKQETRQGSKNYGQKLLNYLVITTIVIFLVTIVIDLSR